MVNKIDYYTHKTYDPTYYHRQYENDLPKNDTSMAKRAALIALPFLSLYQPAGKLISTTMGSIRVLSNSVGAVCAEDMTRCATQVAQVGLATLALAGTLYNFTLGLYLTTGVDLTTNLATILQTLYQSEYKQAGEELLQALSSGLYLAIMMTGSLEVIAASLLMQALVSFYQAKEEWSNGRMPEAFAKSLMGAIRLYQANHQIQQIKRRNILFKQYRAFAERLKKGRAVDHLWEHPLVKRQAATLTDCEGNEYNIGTYAHGYGKQVVKGMNVHLREEDGRTTLEFKVNHVFRDRVEDPISELENISKQDLRDLLQVSSSHIEDISLIKEGIIRKERYFGDLHKIHLKGLGTISIGASREVLTLYDKVTIQMEKGKTLYDFHEALAVLNLDDALRKSASEDIERMKMGHLFRIMDPREATPFERSDPFFDLPMEEFKKEIISRSPEMREAFEKYLPKMELREILPGKMRYAITGLSEELQKKGARGLTALVTGAWTRQMFYEWTASILKMGMLSSEIRNNYGINVRGGMSPGMDCYTGAADSIFTRLVTDKNETFHPTRGPIRLLISPKALETGSYQYHHDVFGSRIIDPNNFFGHAYSDRDNIFEFLQKEQTSFSEVLLPENNEVMIKDRIAPELITGIVIRPELKNDLLDCLRKHQIVKKDAQGYETILSTRVDAFIHVDKTISDEQFTSSD